MRPLLLLGLTAVLTLVVAPRPAAARWALRAPRLALAAWLVGSAAALPSVVLTGLTLLLHWDRDRYLVWAPALPL